MKESVSHLIFCLQVMGLVVKKEEEDMATWAVVNPLRACMGRVSPGK